MRVATMSKAEVTLCPTGKRKLLSTKPTVVAAYTHPVHWGKRSLAAIAIPMNTPPMMNSKSDTRAVIKRGAAYTLL
jgi:hypothetical protein